MAGTKICLSTRARSAAFFEANVKCLLIKKWGILIKKESKSLDFIGLEIPRVYKIERRINYMDVNKEFNKFIAENLGLNKKDISNAVKSREWLIERIIKKIGEKDDGPQLYSENGFNYIKYGSYFKGTKVSNVDEFDIMLIIDASHGVFTKDGYEIAKGIGKLNVNPIFFPQYRKEGEEVVSSRKLLSWLKEIVDEVLIPYGCSAGEKAGQAVTVFIKSKDLHIDFVPGCIFQKNDVYDDSGVVYIIPKGDLNCGWIETNPHIDKNIVNQKGSENEQFKNTIRLFKFIFHNSYKVSIGSYAIESAIVDYESKHFFFNDFEYDFIGILDHIIELISDGKIPDMRDQTVNLIDENNKEGILKKIVSIKSKYQNIDKESEAFSTELKEFLNNE